MAQIEVEIPDELLRQLGNEGKTPTEFVQERLLTFSQQTKNQAPSEISITQKFRKLADQWRIETRHLSLVSDIVLNSAYQQIIGMGNAAIPLLLQELRKQPDHCLTGRYSTPRLALLQSFTSGMSSVRKRSTTHVVYQAIVSLTTKRNSSTSFINISSLHQ